MDSRMSKEVPEKETSVSNTPSILIVDDEPHLCEVLDRLMTKQGYRVRTAPDGATALKLARQMEPDVVLLDVMMPGIDGSEVLRQLRQRTKATRVVIFTAWREDAGPPRVAEIKRDADAFITKPASTRKILASINRVLRLAPRRTTGETTVGRTRPGKPPQRGSAGPISRPVTDG